MIEFVMHLQEMGLEVSSQNFQEGDKMQLYTGQFLI